MACEELSQVAVAWVVADEEATMWWGGPGIKQVKCVFSFGDDDDGRGSSCVGAPEVAGCFYGGSES